MMSIENDTVSSMQEPMDDSTNSAMNIDLDTMLSTKYTIVTQFTIKPEDLLDMSKSNLLEIKSISVDEYQAMLDKIIAKRDKALASFRMKCDKALASSSAKYAIASYKYMLEQIIQDLGVEADLEWKDSTTFHITTNITEE